MFGRILLLLPVFCIFPFVLGLGADSELDLVRIRLDNASNVIGARQRETDTCIEVLDLKTGDIRSFAKADIVSVKKATDKYAIAVAGLPNFIASEIQEHLPPRTVVGKVAARTDRSVYVTLGSEHHVVSKERLGVFRSEDMVRHPDTGEVLGKRQRRIGTLEVIRVEERFCKAQPVSDPKEELKVGDVVKKSGGSDAVAVLPIVHSDGSESIGSRRMTEKITIGLVKRDIPIVERQLLDDVSEELAGQQEDDVFDSATAQRVGRRVGAFAVLVGTITPENKHIRVQLRLVAVETAKVLAALSHVLPNTQIDIASTMWDSREFSANRIRDHDRISGKSADTGGWMTIFHSSDPSIWNKDVKDSKAGYAVPISDVPGNIRYLRMQAAIRKTAPVIVPMTKARLLKQNAEGRYGWDGTNRKGWNGYHLGIYDTNARPKSPGLICVAVIRRGNNRLGWGFGHRNNLDDRQGYSWAGIPIRKTAFEISVKAGHLTPKEVKLLLR